MVKDRWRRRWDDPPRHRQLARQVGAVDGFVRRGAHACV